MGSPVLQPNKPQPKTVSLSAAQQFAVPTALPADALVIGWISAAHGIRGGLRAESFSGNFDTLAGCKQIWLGLHENWFLATVSSVVIRPAFALLELAKLTSRNDAETVQGARIAVARAQLPATEKETFYWIDLVGCSVTDVRGAPLGEIENLISTGAHDVLSIRDETLKSGTRLIPFVDAYVKSVDIKSKRVVVEWDPAWDEA
jgi:16S rRNA processing protein RimM